MTEPNQNTSTSPFPNPEGQYTYSPKVLGQSSLVRQQISRYSTESKGLEIYVNDQPGRADSGSVAAEVFYRTDFNDQDPYGAPTDVTSLINEEADGVYSFRLPSSLTDRLGLLTIHWQYRIDGEPFDYWDYYEILEPMPIYDTMSEPERGIIQMVSMMFGNLYDSTEGGPHLKEEYQTHFGTETLALLMRVAAMKINVGSQPMTNYVVGDNQLGIRMPHTAHSVLFLATYLEVIHHLILSYTEQPAVSGGPGVAFLDRRDYTDRWRAVLADEQKTLDDGIRNFKRSLMGLGGGNLIVGGGIFGGAGNMFRPGMQSALQRGLRFYPVSWVARQG